MFLDRIRIVLVDTTHPGNIGGAARAMKNMGLSQLCLVSPQGFPSAEATVRASGANAVLEEAVVCQSLDEAIAGYGLVIGTSARRRSIEWPALNPRECAHTLLEHAAHSPVALLFGQERAGLTNDAVDQCRYLVTIPTQDEFASLNLAAAVQIMAYEILLASTDAPAPVAESFPTGASTALAPQQNRQGFYAHLERVLVELDFLDPEHPRKLMRKLTRMFNRADLSTEEVNILRGILTQVQKQQTRQP
ncbi:MAG TPA: RNA methyltransferase [Acidiferrobacteraceae bacterium]|nr:RNA methyltransferase [Acidiferrobacteraceae bacterium]